jgi:hypothetical protein
VSGELSAWHELDACLRLIPSEPLDTNYDIGWQATTLTDSIIVPFSSCLAIPATFSEWVDCIDLSIHSPLSLMPPIPTMHSIRHWASRTLTLTNRIMSSFSSQSCTAHRLKPELFLPISLPIFPRPHFPSDLWYPRLSLLSSPRHTVLQVYHLSMLSSQYS